jgi:hypothetical protein
MIYPDIPIDKWMSKFKISSLKCKCNSPKPFLTKEIVGIVCKNCGSGSWVKRDLKKALQLYGEWHGYI